VEPLSVRDYEALARERLAPGPHGYYAGGAGDELTLLDNVEAFRRWQLRPRMLVDVEACTTATTVLGHDISMPLLVAPTAFQRVAHPDGEVATARGALAAGTIMCYSTLATSTPAEVAAVGSQRWFQLYVFRDEGITHHLIEQAREQGFTALVLTVDAPVRGYRERDMRSGFTIPADLPVASIGRGDVTPKQMFELISPSLTWRDLERVAGEAGLPLVVKGVLTAEDARLACEHGSAGIVVSNHGGRQLDSVAASLHVLPEIAAAVGTQIEVLFDGGIRRGADVVKALALGARAVLLGRGYAYGMAAFGEAGVKRALEIFYADFDRTLKLLGCESIDQLDMTYLQRAKAYG
jgi:4-hydroxymandelate oxidase